MDLKELREIFRKRMQEEDFCIGQEQVEKLFRELLDEPEPVEEPYVYNGPPDPKIAEITAVELERVVPKITSFFEKDDTFYGYLRKK